MLPVFTDYLEVLVSDERFLVFASSSVVIALALLFFVSDASRFTKLLLCSAAFLLVFAFVVVAPMQAISAVEPISGVNPVSLNFNFGLLTLGLGLYFKFRRLPVPARETSTK